MIDNFDQVDRFVQDHHLMYKPVVLQFPHRIKDIGQSGMCKYEILQNYTYLDKEAIKRFCDKHKCRSYIHISEDHTLFNLQNFNIKYFDKYVRTHWDEESIKEHEEHRNSGIDIPLRDYYQIDIDDKSELDGVLKWLKDHSVYDIEIFPSKTGYSVICRATFGLFKLYLKDPLFEKNNIHCTFVVNLYIPDFDT